MIEYILWQFEMLMISNKYLSKTSPGISCWFGFWFDAFEPSPKKVSINSFYFYRATVINEFYWSSSILYVAKKK